MQGGRGPGWQRLRVVLLVAVYAGLVSMAPLPSIPRAGATEPGPPAAADLLSDCPCEGPRSGGSWRTPSAYKTCVLRSARDRARVLGLRWKDVRPVAREVAARACGVERGGTPNTELCTDPGLVLACDVLRTAHADDCDECATALAGDLVTCTRAIGAGGVEQRSCAGPPRRGDRPLRILETRTAPDCDTCLAKLGTESPTGVACLSATCGF